MPVPEKMPKVVHSPDDEKVKGDSHEENETVEEDTEVDGTGTDHPAPEPID